MTAEPSCINADCIDGGDPHYEIVVPSPPASCNTPPRVGAWKLGYRQGWMAAIAAADKSWRDAIGCAPETPGSISPEQAVRNVRESVPEPVDLSTAKVGQSAEIRSEPPASSSNSSEIPNSSPDSPVARYACGNEVRAHEYQEIHDLCIEIARLKEKNRELNRRAQSADAAAADAKRCLDALAAGTENGTPWCGGSMGRMLLAWHVSKLEAARAKAIAQLEEIVCVAEPDKGVVLLSYDGPTDWSEEHKCQVFRHEYFSPLGDALIALHETLRAAGEDDN